MIAKPWSDVVGVEILAFEQEHRGSSERTKARAIREHFDVSLSRYTARLYSVIDHDAGLYPNDAELIETLRRERAERRATRTGATARHAGDAGPGPQQHSNIGDIDTKEATE